MQINLDGKTALVTGGNVGIGAGIAKALAKCGAQVSITYFSHESEAGHTLQELKALGCPAEMFQLDATDSDQVATVVSKAAASMNDKIDILVNNAGHLVNRVTTAGMSDEHWRRVIDVNLSSAFFCTREDFEAHARRRPDCEYVVNGCAERRRKRYCPVCRVESWSYRTDARACQRACATEDHG